MDSKVENNNSSKEESRDEVDFIPTTANATATKKEICVSCKSFNPLKKGFLMRNSTNHINNNNNTTPKTPHTKKTSAYGECELQTAVKSHISALERLNLFHFPLRKKSESSSESSGDHEKSTVAEQNSNNHHHHRPRLIKSSSIARLFGNTYSTKKSENSANTHVLKKSLSVSEKFSNRSNESDEEFVLRISEYNHVNLSTSTSNLNSLEIGSAPMEKPANKNAIKSITKGLGKLLRRNHSSVEISPPDPEYKVLYLGNVLTGWAKGEL